jgi:hypothetical protein
MAPKRPVNAKKTPPTVVFTPDYIRTWMGGEFHIPPPATVADLVAQFREILTELEGWNQDLEIAEVYSRGRLGFNVILRDGVPGEIEAG